MDLIDEIAEVARAVRPSTWEHPQYDRGTLYVTPPQLDALKKVAVPGSNIPPLGINIAVLEPGIPVKLSTGKTLLYSEVMGELYVIDSSVFRF